jgi:hypothetical protein
VAKKKPPAPEGQPAEQQQAQGGRTPPVHECRVGRIRGIVWRNDGQEGPWFSVNITRSYKDGAGNWKTATSYGRDDLLVVAEVSRLCWLWIAQQAGTNLGGQANGNGSGHGAGEDDVPI